MKKKLIGVLLSVTMIATLFAGCGKKTEDTSASTPTKAAAKTEDTTDNTNATPTPTMVPNQVIGDQNVENPFYIYDWNTEVQTNVLDYFKKHYPEDAKRIVFVNTGGTNNYQTKLDAALQDSNNAQYPDMFAMEMDYILKYTNSDYTLPVTDCGITDADLSNMYPYTVQAATVDNKIKGISWQACPGAVMYRRSLAKKYLGTDDPEKVQEYFKDWKTTLETGKTIIKKSNGATKLFSGVDDVKRVYEAGRTNPWYDKDSNIVVDQVMLDYMDYAKQLYDLGLTNNTTQWSDTEWTANMSKDNTFAYMGCTWFLQWSLKPNCGATYKDDGSLDDSKDKGTYGDWGMCYGPQAYYWGGTWLGVSKDCSDKELAGKILKAICDKDIMKEMSVGTKDYVNNKEAVKELIAEGKGKFDFLAGQDFLSFFSVMADKITLPAMCGEDLFITNSFDTQVNAYITGSKDKDSAVADFKSTVTDLYPYLTAN